MTTDKASSETPRIRDLVEIPEIRTVIQMEDLKDPGFRRMLTETFVITDEVFHNLEAVFTSISSGEGRGVFLKGHFGSGKSHFLGILSVLFRYPATWDTALSQAPSLSAFLPCVKRRWLTVEISLVQHRGSEFLEDIILRGIFDEMGEDAAELPEQTGNRRETFSGIREILRRKGFAGMLLLVDELSEFLRSKSDARAYNEDIRFLQYLGETAGDFPFWIIASLQEWIEETGEIHQDTFNKIKDRYRIRLSLGRAHIEELVSERLIRRREGAETAIGKIYDDLRSFFPSFPVSKDRFIRLYPVHPATSTLLDRLKPLFSEHRGVVDFIHFRLRGDPERHIPPWLDRPADRLLAPETIFDHFLDRIRERSESQVFVEKVFEVSRDEIPELFGDPDQRRAALSLLKLLILFAISPVPYRYTVRHMAEMLLFRITPMESEVNYQFIHHVLERLANEGSFVRVDPREDPLDNCYSIDLKADLAAILRRRIRHTASGLFPEDHRLFWKIAPLAHTAHLPLKNWVETGRQGVGLRWQHTRRSGTLLLRQLDELTLDEIDGLSRQWHTGEEDFFLLVGTTRQTERQYAHVKAELLPKIRERRPGVFLFWIPGESREKDDWLQEVLAAIILKEGILRDSNNTAAEELAFLQRFVDQKKGRLAEHFSERYFSGVLLWDENRVDLSRFGRLTQEKFLSEFIPPLLERRFPGHGRIQPYMDALAPGILRDMLSDFLSSGILVVDNRAKFGIRDVLEGLLQPMGLIRKHGNRYELRVNPKRNELARSFFEEMVRRETVPLEEIYRTFRKGPYGLMRPHFEILVLALLFSGHLIAYRGTRRKGYEELSRSGLKGVTALGRGEILPESARRAMARHPLIPRKYRDMPVTLASQEEIWAGIKAEKPAALERLEALTSKIRWAMAFEAFRDLPWERVRADIAAVKRPWEAVTVSLGSREGLERFLKTLEEEPSLGEKMESVSDCEAFLANAERALFVYQYLTDQRLRIPADAPDSRDEVQGDAPATGFSEDYRRLRELRAEILAGYRPVRSTVSPDTLTEVFEKFREFQELYIRVYSDAHAKARGGDQFAPYERLTRSRRYRLLQRLDRLEMVSVEHNRHSVDQGVSSVLLNRCGLSCQEILPAQPVCSCGFQLGGQAPLKPVKEIENEIDQGIRETFEALKTPAIQEKIIPYLEGLDLVGRETDAAAIRRLLELSPDGPGFVKQLDRLLTPAVLTGINEAFRGKVVVVKRDLDRLYRNLVHRRYPLSRVRAIIEEWLDSRDLSSDTFLHFLGQDQGVPADHRREAFKNFVEKTGGPLLTLYREIGYRRTAVAVVVATWSRQYRLPLQKVSEVLPFLKRGGPAEEERWISELRDMGRALASIDPGLFESLVALTAEDAALMRELWSTLSGIEAGKIFRTESLLVPVLKEAFDRVFSEGTGEGAVEGTVMPGADALPSLTERKGRMISAVETLHQIRKKARVPEPSGVSGAESFKRWEAFFIRGISPLPFLIANLRVELKQIGTKPPSRTEREERLAREKIARASEQFSRFYRENLPLWEASERPGPLMIQDIPFLLKKKRSVPDHREVRYLLMDGMRWDLWEYIKKRFFEHHGNHFRVVREGALWSGAPTNTASQMARLEPALQQAYPDIPRETILWKISGIDEKIHSEKGSLVHLFANVTGFLEIDLLFRLKELSSGTLLVIFADHGFVRNPAFDSTNKYEAPRYTHGKDSPFEVIVPWAWIMRL